MGRSPRGGEEAPSSPYRIWYAFHPGGLRILTLPDLDSSLRKHLASLGLAGAAGVHRNLSVSSLYEHALRNGEGELGADGQFVAETGEHTGRSPKDKFFVREPGSETHIDWGETNKAIEPAAFARPIRRSMKSRSFIT